MVLDRKRLLRAGEQDETFTSPLQSRSLLQYPQRVAFGFPESPPATEVRTWGGTAQLPRADMTIVFAGSGGAIAIEYDPKRARRQGTGDVGWLDSVLAQLEEISGLPEGWNSYGAARTDTQTAIRAIRLLRASAGPSAPPPTVVPTPDGGVQLEWHERGIDLEVELTPHRQVFLHYCDDVHGEDWDREITDDLPALTRVLSALSSRR